MSNVFNASSNSLLSYFAKASTHVSISWCRRSVSSSHGHWRASNRVPASKTSQWSLTTNRRVAIVLAAPKGLVQPCWIGLSASKESADFAPGVSERGRCIKRSTGQFYQPCFLRSWAVVCVKQPEAAREQQRPRGVFVVSVGDAGLRDLDLSVTSCGVGCWSASGPEAIVRPRMLERPQDD